MSLNYFVHRHANVTGFVFAYFATRSTKSQATGNCRFANKYDVKDIIENDGIREAFINDYFVIEQEFINQPDISLHPHLFTTYDGSQLNFQTGTKRNSRAWTASSKESLHLMYLLHLIQSLLQLKNHMNSYILVVFCLCVIIICFCIYCYVSIRRSAQYGKISI